MQGRLPDEFRERVKRYAAGVIRLFVKLPKAREECGIEPALIQPLEKESSELIAIFATMIQRTRGRS